MGKNGETKPVHPRNAIFVICPHLPSKHPPPPHFPIGVVRISFTSAEVSVRECVLTPPLLLVCQAAVGLPARPWGLGSQLQSTAKTRISRRVGTRQTRGRSMANKSDRGMMRAQCEVHRDASAGRKLAGRCPRCSSP